MTPTYETTKQFTEWLKEVRPDFEIESDYFIAHYNSGDEINCYYDSSKEGIQAETCVLITTDALHAILWELFDVENPLILKYCLEMIDGNNSVEQFNYIRGKRWKTPDCFADELWVKYTSHKESMWKINPDAVFEDIMKTYTELFL